MRRAILVFLALVLGLGMLAATAFRIPSVQDRVLRRAVDRALASPADALFEEDALRVLLCGSSGPLPHASRAGPCVAVLAGGRFYVVDVGRGSWNRLAGWRIDGARIGAVLLTHFHSDHIQELGEYDLQTWVAGRSAPLRVFGPPGVDRVVAGFEEAYALDAGYRVAHHGAELLAPEVGRMDARVVAEPGLVLEEGGLRVTAFAVDHDPVRPAYGYRFDYRGRSVVVSGDTSKTAGVVEAARGADVLFHEAQANHIVAVIGEATRKAGRPRVAKIMSDIPDYHTTPSQAADVANQADVPLVVFYHLTPPPPLRLLERMYVRGVSEVRDEGWILGDDGLLVELPAGSDAVIRTSLGG
ncbi:MAG: MBL fold metallo-hydrolase [Deltaproteobacteria bacterium]|nr:MBL fold metallo-hydrolase [Deltaproteobacteria bacterium]